MEITCNEIIITKPLEELSVGDTFYEMETSTYNMIVDLNSIAEDCYIKFNEELIEEDEVVFALDLRTGTIWSYWKKDEVRPIKLNAEGHF